MLSQSQHQLEEERRRTHAARQAEMAANAAAHQARADAQRRIHVNAGNVDRERRHSSERSELQARLKAAQDRYDAEASQLKSAKAEAEATAASLSRAERDKELTAAAMKAAAEAAEASDLMAASLKARLQEKERDVTTTLKDLELEKAHHSSAVKDLKILEMRAETRARALEHERELAVKNLELERATKTAELEAEEARGRATAEEMERLRAEAATRASDLEKELLGQKQLWQVGGEGSVDCGV